MQIVLSDLDSTLCNTDHRSHLATGSTSHEDWVAYSKACVDDPVIEPVARTLHAFARLYPVGFVSGRNVEAIDETYRWLTQQAAFSNIWGVRLRQPTDEMHNGLYKVKYIQHLQARGIMPIVMFEDHLGVAEMIEGETGVPVVRVTPPYVDTVGSRFNNVEETPAEVPC